MNFGDVPELSRKQKLLLMISGQAFLRFQQPDGYRLPVAVYVVRCSKHGLYLDTPHGFNGYFQCNDCLAEAVAETKSVVDLGFCPRCKDVIQPEHSEGYASRPVDGVLFCTLCAWHVESDPAERRKWVEWAKTEAAN